MDASPPVVVPRWLIYVLVWLVPGLIQAATSYVNMAVKGEPLPLLDTLLWRVPEWQVWAAATPVIFALARRFPVWKAPWVSVPLHLALCAAVNGCDVIVHFYCGRLIGQEPYVVVDAMDLVPWMLLKTAFFELLVYAAVLVAEQALAYQRRYREAALRQTQLEARLAEAQLDALKMQLHPHFLFNTINAITVLMRKGESAAAIRMLNGMSELLRRSLTSLQVEMVALDEELDFIRRYLDIETTRFPDRLRVSIDVDEAARAARVPSLILQPIVENAIEHGIVPRVDGGTITIRARIVSSDGARLRIEVRDDGAGLRDVARPKGHGVGLSNVRKRLAQLYPDDHRFTLEPGAPTGAGAVLEIPVEED
ncbi:MAG: histidine kinase [Deltaproteobacteria bacterium]|nr:histidine kinase [Deltaproteobacteria bacterium]